MTGKTNLSDKQFDRLREDLSWEVNEALFTLHCSFYSILFVYQQGSALVTLNRQETRFLNAMQVSLVISTVTEVEVTDMDCFVFQSYSKNQPVMSDVEFDELKQSLKEQGSKLAVATEPKCYVDTGVCKVTWSPDSIRTTSLYVPATLLLSVLYLGIVSSI